MILAEAAFLEKFAGSWSGLENLRI